ncbi:MAG: metal-dependent hydrolase [Candidatus Woesearchaeota archaeon]
MLGRNHVSISLATIMPFLIPLIFLESNNSIIYGFAFLISILVGSLLPDADCGGKSKLYYDFNIFYQLIIPITKLTVWTFKLSSVKKKLSTKFSELQDVNHEHRGIMHSPIGTIVSSFLLTLIILIIMTLIAKTNLLLVLIIFLGLIIGQILHLLEDSCTVTGINWMFPFGKKELKGQIYTFEWKYQNKKDIRPMIYVYSLVAVSIISLLVNSFGAVNNLFLYYLITTIAVLIIWIIIIKISQSQSIFWYRDAEKIKQIQKKQRKALKKFTGIKRKKHKKRSYKHFKSRY